MTSTLKKIAGCLCLSLWLTACGSSPPSNFYRLTPAVVPTPGNQQPSLGIGPVDIPEFLDRNAMVYTRDGNQLWITGTERWAEPLDIGIKRVVGLNLSQLLHSENLRFFPWDVRQAPDYGVRITVLDLDASDGRATLVADWQVYSPGNDSVISRRISQFSQPLASGQTVPAELPAAYSALLYQLSETVAAAIQAEEQQRAAANGAQ